MFRLKRILRIYIYKLKKTFQYVNMRNVKFKDLDSVRNWLNTIPNLNKGGCGVSAYAIG
jgi:hypothetical protein